MLERDSSRLKYTCLW